MSLTTEIRFTLNGVQQRASVSPDMSALQLLRDMLGLTGTKYGCGEGECGACTILVDGRAVNACLLFALDCEGRTLTTIEGLAQDARARVVQESFVAHGAVQCGFCTPGMVMQATSLLADNAQPDGTSAAVRTACTPGRARARDASMRTMRACTRPERRIAACSWPGSEMSWM